MQKTVIFFFLLLTFFPIWAQKTVIRNVGVINVNTGKVQVQSVVLSDGRIEWLGADKNLKPIIGATLINGTGKYLLPGLIDTHIHFFQSGGLYTRPDVIDLRKKVPYEQERATGLANTHDYLQRYLRLGITTVVDVGGPFSNFQIRDSLSKQIVSPNILVTGPLFSMVSRPQLALNDPPIIEISSTQAADSLFHRMLPYKPDFIKVWFIANPQHPAVESFPLVKHIGQLAAAHRLKLVVHATELETAQLAVEAGASILVHSITNVVIPDSFVKVLRDKQITYVPTLLVGFNYDQAFMGMYAPHRQDLTWANPMSYGTLKDMEGIPTAELPRWIQWMRTQKRWAASIQADSIAAINLKKLVQAGIRVATGTDAGNIGTQHASSYLPELETMRKAGISNLDVLKASTIQAAIGFGLADRLGSIEKSKQADLLLLRKNPLDTLLNLNSIEMVFKNGQAIAVDTLISESAEMIVQRQVNAYNARDIEAFLATYADDIELIRGDKVVMKGKEDMRKHYEGFFASTPNLYCKIENRIVINNKVIDKENVRSGTKTFQAVAIYEVEHQKIKRVTFVK